MSDVVPGHGGSQGSSTDPATVPAKPWLFNRSAISAVRTARACQATDPERASKLRAYAVELTDEATVAVLESLPDEKLDALYRVTVRNAQAETDSQFAAKAEPELEVIAAEAEQTSDPQALKALEEKAACLPSAGWVAATPAYREAAWKAKQALVAARERVAFAAARDRLAAAHQTLSARVADRIRTLVSQPRSSRAHRSARRMVLAAATASGGGSDGESGPEPPSPAARLGARPFEQPVVVLVVEVIAFGVAGLAAGVAVAAIVAQLAP